MRCPTCGGRDFVRYRSPVEVKYYTIRRHRCRLCQSAFLSIQFVLEGRKAEALLGEVEWKALKASDKRSALTRVSLKPT